MSVWFQIILAYHDSVLLNTCRILWGYGGFLVHWASFLEDDMQGNILHCPMLVTETRAQPLWAAAHTTEIHNCNIMLWKQVWWSCPHQIKVNLPSGNQCSSSHRYLYAISVKIQTTQRDALILSADADKYNSQRHSMQHSSKTRVQMTDCQYCIF